MSDARWIEVDDDFKKAATLFGKAVDVYTTSDFSDDPSDLENFKSEMAFMHAMQSGHTSLENGLVRILDIMKEDVPTGRNWHADLISRAARKTDNRPAILTDAVMLRADETRRFRNVATRNYSNFRIDEARKAVEAAQFLAQNIVADILRFKNVIDPPTQTQIPSNGYR